MPRLTAILATLLAICLPSLSSAKYFPPLIFDLLGTSDLIVIGSISRVETKTFHLDVEEVLRGTAASRTLEIERFRNWTCSRRWQPYAVGQRVVAFLSRQEGPFRLRSAGAEGEFPISGDDVLIHGYSVPGPTGEISGRPFGRRLPLEHLRSAVRDLPTCYRFQVIEGRSGPRIDDIEVVRRYMARLVDNGIADRVFMMIGIGPLASARSARWMRDNLHGVIVPDAIIERLDHAADPKADRTVSGSMGTWVTASAAPTASLTAAAMAATAPVIPPSPQPLMPRGLVGRGSCSPMTTSSCGASAAVGSR